MNVKLESPRGEAFHVAQAAFDADPPDVIRWAERTFRYVRTDGIFDQKKHVYREASVHDLPAEERPSSQVGAGQEGMVNRAESGAKAKDERQVSLTLTGAQAALLRRVRTSGAHASPKAAIIAGLEALEGKHTVSNGALLKLLAERLGDVRRR